MSTGEHQEIRDLLEAHALGALDAAEARRVEAHLAAGCGACEALLADYARVAERLAAPVEPVTPSETTRARVLAAVAAAPRGGATAAPAAATPARTLPPRRGSAAVAWLAAAASIAALVLGGWLALTQGELRREVRRAAGERARMESERAADRAALAGELARTRGEIARLASSLGFVASPGNRAIQLAGLGPAPEASGTTVFDPRGGRAVFYASGLPDPGPGKTYELWFFTDEGPQPAGVFGVDRRGEGQVEVEPVAEPGRVVAWAVTIEPEGGLPKPSGPAVLSS